MKETGAPLTNLDARSVRRIRTGALIAVLAATGLAYLIWPAFRSELRLAFDLLAGGDIAGLRDYILSFGAWAPVISTFLMVLQAVAAPLPAFVITFANGLAFGAFWGGMLSLFGATLAAAVSFWISRALGRGPVKALVGGTSLESADRWFARYGAYTVLVARLIPVISFDVISFAAGLTRLGFPGFILATVVGMAPATFIYAYLGGNAPQYVEALLAVFAVVIAIGLVAALLRRRQAKRRVN